MEWARENLLSGAASYVFVPGLALGAFGLLFVVLGLNAQRTRRLSNARSLYLVLGTTEFQGRTAVFMGEVIAFVGYVFIGLAALAMLTTCYMVFAKSRTTAKAATTAAPAYNPPSAPSNQAAPNQTATNQPAGTGAAPGVNSPNSAGSYSTPREDSAPKQSNPPTGSAPSTPPWGSGAPPWASSPPGGVGSPGGLGPPGGEFNEAFRKMQEDAERRRREMEERHRNFRNGQPFNQPNAPSAGPARPVREWKSVNGKYTITASLVEQTATEAVLRQSDGSTVRVEKSKLSSEDQKWLAENP